MGERVLRRGRKGHRSGKAAFLSLALVLDLGYSLVSFCQRPIFHVIVRKVNQCVFKAGTCV